MPKTKEKTVYLTFDDGPYPKYTEWVLEILEKYNAQATFFCLGSQAQLFPDILQKTIEKGHKIGAHGMDHLSGFTTQNKKYLENALMSAQLLQTTLFRPPYGRPNIFSTPKLLQKFRLIFWTYLVGDFKQNVSIDKELLNLKKNTEDGAIVVFHDNPISFENLQKILPKYLEWLVDNGYKFSIIN